MTLSASGARTSPPSSTAVHSIFVILPTSATSSWACGAEMPSADQARLGAASRKRLPPVPLSAAVQAQKKIGAMAPKIAPARTVVCSSNKASTGRVAQRRAGSIEKSVIVRTAVRSACSACSSKHRATFTRATRRHEGYRGLSRRRLRRSALAMTDTELRLMAALAIIGLSKRPKSGYNAPAAMGTPTTL